MPRASVRFPGLLVGGLVWMLGAGSAQGQSIPSPYRFVDTRMEAGVFAGQNLSVGAGAFGIGAKAGPVVGARYGLVVGGPFSLEANVAYADAKRDVKDPGPEGDFVTVGEAEMRLLTADARIKFMLVGERTWHRISPHALVGAGITFDLAGSQPADELLLEADRYSFGNSFSGLLGFGVRWFLSDRFLVRPDLTLQLWQQDIPSGYADRDALVAAPSSEWIQSWALMIGLSYTF